MAERWTNRDRVVIVWAAEARGVEGGGFSRVSSSRLCRGLTTGDSVANFGRFRPRALLVWHHVRMGWKEFYASVIGDLLSWPVIALVIILVLFSPIRALIGRIKSAKALGGEFEFSETIGGVEESTDKAVEDAPVAAKTDGSPAVASSNGPLGGREIRGEGGPRNSPEVNPSGAILHAWESLISALSDLSRVNAGRGRPARNPSAIVRQVRESGFFSTSFYEAIDSLREARNQVAHGEAVPTVGAAITFVESANQLESMVRGQIAVTEMDLNKSLPGAVQQ